MNPKMFLGIAWRIIALFIVVMLTTFLPEHLHAFFGDTPNPGVQGGYDWGVRHYWYKMMCGLLFLLSIINLIITICNMSKRYYPTVFDEACAEAEKNRKVDELLERYRKEGIK